MSPSTAHPTPQTSFLLLPLGLGVCRCFGTLRSAPGPERPSLTGHAAYKSLIIYQKRSVIRTSVTEHYNSDDLKRIKSWYLKAQLKRITYRKLSKLCAVYQNIHLAVNTTSSAPVLHSGHGGLLQTLRFDGLLQLPQLSQQRPLPQAKRLALRFLLVGLLLIGQPAVGLFQSFGEDSHHVEAGGRRTIPGDGQPGPLEEQVQLGSFILQAVDALADSGQLGATVLQYRSAAAGGALHS